MIVCPPLSKITPQTTVLIQMYTLKVTHNWRKKVCAEIITQLGHTLYIKANALCFVADVTQGETSAIIIFKGSDPLGVNLVGGADSSLHGVYVQRIVPDSPAAKDDRLRAGDRILAIGSLTLENMTKEEVLQAIQQAGSFVRLTILRQTTGAMETVELVKPDGGGLGLLISELKDLPGIYVQEVVSEGRGGARSGE